ncbi:unnamed protein product [Leptosia nina]|uniref:Insulin-like domain-containing protein n=1 Tax=Leptosia nina TaxID=320188 RepID=A0AAV1JXK8_9NEOP
MKPSIVLFSALVLLLAEGLSGQGQVYCGRRLADTLAYMCDNPLINGAAGNSLLIKRSDRYQNAITPEDFKWPWIQRHHAKSIRNKRQVVSECCDKPCSLNELLSYC